MRNWVKVDKNVDLQKFKNQENFPKSELFLFYLIFGRINNLKYQNINF